MLFIYIVLDVWPKKESNRHVSYGLHIRLSRINLESGFSRLFVYNIFILFCIHFHFRFRHVTKYGP